MLQGFSVTSSPEQAAPRLAALREQLSREKLHGFLVPRSDVHQGEYVAPRDQRLAWLTGFTGSAGFAAVLTRKAAVFSDGRYRLQLRSQTDGGLFEPVDWPETTLARWLREALLEEILAEAPIRIGFDPWLHSLREIKTLREGLEGTPIELLPVRNQIDAIWNDQPEAPAAPATDHPLQYSGLSSGEKRHAVAQVLQAQGDRAAVLTLPDSICWLLNIRGSDIPRVPIVHAFALIYDDGRTEIFAAASKLAQTHLPEAEGVRILPPEEFEAALDWLETPVRVDPATIPYWVADRLNQAGVGLSRGADPCQVPKACKNDTEIAGARQAHVRDGVAMAQFLAWLDDAAAAGGLSEIDVVTRLEEFRQATGALQDISFETIAGSGPNGAIVHYRVTQSSNRTIGTDELLLIDSGGQYLDGTTDVTRTVAIGRPSAFQQEAFTRVLKGMIAISRVRWPLGMAGKDLDPLARVSLWEAGLDYGHGTGHGVGSYLSVHDGPQRIARTSDVTLLPGMILSNEPGYYREGEFGIRIENLVVVEEAPAQPWADPQRQLLQFATLTLAPVDRRLILPELLTEAERDWLNAYHRRVAEELVTHLDPATADWLKSATAPL